MNTTSSSRRRRSPRGQALVETVVTLLVLLPILLYTAFLTEYLRYALQWQEAVVTPAFNALAADFDEDQYRWVPAQFDPPNWNVMNFNVVPYPTTTFNAPQTNATIWGGNAAVKVQGFARVTYCDHTAAADSRSFTGGGPGVQNLAQNFDAYANAQECADPNPQMPAAFARPSWRAPGGDGQISCALNTNVGLYPGQHARLNNPGPNQNVRRSGLVSCTGRLAVVNQFLGQRIFQLPAEALLTGRTKAPPGSLPTANNSWTFGRPANDPQAYRFGMLHGNWGLAYVKNLDPRYADTNSQSFPLDPGGDVEGQDRHPLYKRVEPFYFGPRALGPQNAALNFTRNVFGQNQLVNAAAAFGLNIPGGLGLMAPEALLDNGGGGVNGMPAGIGNDPRTPSIFYRMLPHRMAGVNGLNRYESFEYWNQGTSRFRRPHTNPVAGFGAGYGNPQIRDAWGHFAREYYAAGWDDVRQRQSWANRGGQGDGRAAGDPGAGYWGRPEAGWYDQSP